MLVPEIDRQFINKVLIDHYNRVSGIFLVNKPVGATSHDIVDEVRKILRTRKVGHAGALDPFAEGLLLILVGKYTRYTEALISLDKSYEAGLVFGIKTTTQDPEGEILDRVDVKMDSIPNIEELGKMLTDRFVPEYEQLVPIYSSVKVKGVKLRELARDSEKFENVGKGEVLFTLMDKYKSKYKGDQVKLIIPRKKVKITTLDINEISPINQVYISDNPIDIKGVFLETKVYCSKGTYIRQLAEDIGEVLSLPSFLYKLKRTSIGGFSLEEALSLDRLSELAADAGIQNKYQ